MKTKSARFRVGDETWFIEWCPKLVFDENGDCDHDRCVDNVRKAATKEEAERIAREVYPETTNAFGVVSYYPARFVPYDEDDAAEYPHAGFWDAIGETEHYEGDE
jgi:hypothetical protein